MTIGDLSCEESLAAMVTAPVTQLVGESPLARHAVACPECGRVARVLIERDRSLALQAPAAAEPRMLGGYPTNLIRRRLAFQLLRAGSIAVAVMIGWLYIAQWVNPAVARYRERDATRAEVATFKLRCLTPDAAAALINPYLTGKQSGIFPRSPTVPAIVVRGTASQIAHASNVIAQFDFPEGGCPVKSPAPLSPAP